MGRPAELDEATMKKRGAKGVCGSNVMVLPSNVGCSSFNHRHYGRLPLGVLRSVEAATELSEHWPTSIQSTGEEEVGIGCVLFSINGIIYQHDSPSPKVSQ